MLLNCKMPYVNTMQVQLIYSISSMQHKKIRLHVYLSLSIHTYACMYIHFFRLSFCYWADMLYSWASCVRGAKRARRWRTQVDRWMHTGGGGPLRYFLPGLEEEPGRFWSIGVNEIRLADYLCYVVRVCAIPGFWWPSLLFPFGLVIDCMCCLWV